MTNPWDDLTNEELKKMVDFCQKYLTCRYYPDCQEDEGYQEPRVCVEEMPAGCIIRWEWKKGAWRWDDGQIEVLPFDMENTYTLRNCIPLPLAHQWMALIGNINDELGFFPDEIRDDRTWCVADPDGDFCESHRNPHYAGYLAFRKVIECE